MLLVKPSHKIEFITPNSLELIEAAGRTCYKSEDKITKDSAEKFVSMVIKRGHHSVIEHANMTVRFICDRGVTHEIVRHRLFAYSQESTRYVGYSDKLIKNAHMSEDEVVDLYEGGMSMKNISILSDGKYTEWCIYKILDNNNIKRRNLGNTGVINDTFFEVIDTPEKAYLIGFILADGSLHKDSNQITITQKNGWFIGKMLENFIKPNLSSYSDRVCNSYSFCNNKLYGDLVSKGIIPNKSNNMDKDDAGLLWKAVNNEYVWDFLRGFMDGDGSLRFFNQANKGKTDSCTIIWNGNKDILVYISELLYNTFNYKTNILKVSGAKKLYRIVITKPDIGDAVCKKMYANFVFPYGHPIKTSRAYDRNNFDIKYAEWGHSEFRVIVPKFFELTPALWVWAESMDNAEKIYSSLMCNGYSPQQARAVLPNSLKTEIVCTANFREWRHVFTLRCSKAAHPQMRELMIPLLEEVKTLVPVIFDDIEY